MINRRPYIAETAVKPGCAVVQGKADNGVKTPGAKGEGDFIGIYSFEANEEKAVGEPIGIALHGVVKALTGGNVSAGKKAMLKADASGTLTVLPETSGKYSVVGTFLESGFSGDYVDVLIERGAVAV